MLGEVGRPVGGTAMAEVGIDDIAIHFPRLYFDMKDFAEMRGADYGKLHKGLGLTAMAIPDVHEDTATMGANAVTRLIDRNGVDPRKVGRMYLGTESALDGSKPTATYILDMLNQRYQKQYGEDCFRNCDVVDMTFACIGAVDALHNTLDWVARGNGDDRYGIVIFSDNAKYDLESSGEYTQGAGGGALLIRQNPRLLTIPDCWGVSTTPVHDFFKPRREVSIRSVINHVLQLAKEAGGTVKEGLADRMVKHLPESTVRRLGIFAHGEKSVSVHRDEPIFDGQFSNRCYQEAVKTAFVDFKQKAETEGRWNPETDQILTEQWSRIVMHLPYAFQAKRMFPDVFRRDRMGTPVWEAIEAELGPIPIVEDYSDDPEGEAVFNKDMDTYRRAISKTPEYQTFHAERIEKGQRASSLIGNQYTGSIFLAMMSTFESDYEENSPIQGTRFGLCGYGSGAKAKVWEGVVADGWREVVAGWNMFERLAGRLAIDEMTYEALHKGLQEDSVVKPRGEFALVEIEEEGVREGARSYIWIE